MHDDTMMKPATNEAASSNTQKYAAAVADFAKMLKAVRRVTGNASLRDIAHRGGRVSHMTISRAFDGKSLPSWRTVEAILDGCRAAEHLRRRVSEAWYNVVDLVDPIGVPFSEIASPPPIQSAVPPAGAVSWRERRLATG